MDSSRCRLVLSTPASPAPSVFADALTAAFAGGDISTLILALDSEDENHWRDIADIARPAAINAGAAFLIADRLNLVESLNADGIHVETGRDDLPAILDAMSPDRITGAGAIFNRHTAMKAGEAGVDYVFFGRVNLAPDDRKAAETVKKLTEWWGPLFQVPCVAFATTMEDAEDLIQLGADFIAVRDLVWTSSDGPEAAIREINLLIDKGPELE
jgi:thiamine-phosphate pyrophosphorylase